MVSMGDGRIKPDDPASRYVPRWRDDPKRRDITVGTWRTHTLGIEDAEARPPPRPLTGWKGTSGSPPAALDPFTLAGPGAVLDVPGTKGTLQQPRDGECLATP